MAVPVNSGGGRGSRAPKRKVRKRSPERPAPAPQTDVQSSGGDYGTRQAERHKKTKTYKKASRAGYTGGTVEQRQQVLAHATGTEAAVARKTHKQRVRRRKELEKSKAQHDVVTDDDLAVAAAALDALRKSPRASGDARTVNMRYIHRTGHAQPSGGLTRAAKRELEGHGVLAAALGKLAESIDTGTPGVPKAARLDNSGPRIAERFAKDVATLPSQAVPSVYVPAAGIVEAAQGKPSRIKRFAKDVNEGDALFNVAAAGVEAAQGHGAAAKRRLERAAESVSEHPGFAAAEALPIVKGLHAPIKAKPTTVKLEGTGLTTKVRKRKAPDQFPEKEIRKRVDERVGITGTERDPFLQEFAVTNTSGDIRRFTRGGGWESQADRVAADLHQRTGHEFTKVRSGRDDVLVPKAALDRLHEHEARNIGPKTTAGKAMSAATGAFRKTVLTTSTSWALGNVAEATLRAAVNRAGPRSYLTGRKVMRRVKQLDPDKGAELAQRVAGGGHYSFSERAQIQDVAHHFAGSSIEPLANALHKTLRTPGPKQVAGLWKLWSSGVFEGMRAVERQFQVAQLGKHVRSDLLDGRLLKLSDRAIDEAAQGLRDTNTQVQLARAVEDAYGRYQGFSPSTRMLVSHYSPFVAWFLNSVNWIGHVLPRDHPAVVGLTAAAEQATEEWRKDHGLDLWMKEAVPGWLQGSIPTEGGGKLRASRFTPFGAFGDLPGTLSGQVLPLQSGPLMALKGLTWQGNRIHAEGGEGERQAKSALMAIGEFIDATIPVVSQAKRIESKGLAALNPLEPVAPKEKKPRKVRRRSPGVRWSDQSGGVRWADQDSGLRISPP